MDADHLVYRRERVAPGRYEWKEYRPERGALTGHVDLWTIPRRIFVPIKDRETGEVVKVPIWTPERKAGTVMMTQLAWSDARCRFEVR